MKKIIIVIMSIIAFLSCGCAKYYKVTDKACIHKCIQGLISCTKDYENISPEIISKFENICKKLVQDKDLICVDCKKGVDCNGIDLISKTEFERYYEK